MRRLAWLSIAALIWSCGGESTRPSSPTNGCTSGACPEVGGAGGSSTDGAGGTDGGKGGTTPTCTGPAPLPDPTQLWANWTMPNPASSGLANPAKYDTSRSDVVIDELTGLMWPKSASPVDDELSFDAAVAYCAELESGDYCDWRLPTRIELTSLVDFTQREPATDRSVFSDFPEAGERVGWGFLTSSSSGNDEWWILFHSGTTVSIERGTALQGARARCVRVHEGSAPPEPRYSIEGQAPDDVVTDRGTQLSWQRRPSQQTYDFDAARAYCTDLALQGAGWRLPSVKELQTIVDESRPSPAIDEEIFPDLPESAAPGPMFRTSSPSADCPDCAWLMRADGSVFDTGVDARQAASHYVRCVRSSDS